MPYYSLFLIPSKIGIFCDNLLDYSNYFSINAHYCTF